MLLDRVPVLGDHELGDGASHRKTFATSTEYIA